MTVRRVAGFALERLLVDGELVSNAVGKSGCEPANL
jgi:hypothetical protein